MSSELVALLRNSNHAKSQTMAESLMRQAATEIERLERQDKHHRDLIQAYSDMARAR